MSRLHQAVERTRNKADNGVTLIELLVVITILGVLAAIVTFSVAGLSNNAEEVAKATDASTVLTAEEAYFAEHGVYASADELVSAGFLSGKSTLNPFVVLSPDKKKVLAVLGGAFPASQPAPGAFTTGPLILAASNTTTPFTYLASDFASKNTAVQFSFGSSATLASTANAGGNSVLFASADEANVLSTIATGDAVHPTLGGLPGTCSGTCAGIGSTKRQYATGRLVVYSCKTGGATLLASPSCAAPTGGFLNGSDASHPAAPRSVTDVITILRNAQTPAYPATASSCSRKLTIANPGASLPLSGGSAATAPYGYAAWEALTNKGSSTASAGNLSAAEFTALQSAGCITYGSNVTATQTNVVSGAADMAMLPLSFEVSPFGSDTNNWTTVSSSLHSPIKQWAVVLNHGSAADRAVAQAFLDYLLSTQGRGVLAAYGYDPVS